MAKAEFAGLRADFSYEIRVAEWGCLENECGDVGEEFNPFKVEAAEPVWTRYGWKTP